MSELNTPVYDDEAIKAQEAATRKEKIASDAQRPPDPEALLEIRHLRKCFPIEKTITGKVTRELVAVDDVSFKLMPGETLGIVGESGCGKTTMGRTLLKLHEPSGGQIFFKGKDISQYSKAEMRPIRTQMQIIFQDPYSSLPPRATVGDILSEPVKVHKIVPEDQVKDYVLDLMDKCGLRDYYYERYPHEFSGGQRQRICIARALSVNPELVVCDEPVSALDVSIQAQILNLLKQLQRQLGLTYVFISHDLAVVRHVCNRVAGIEGGSIVEQGDTESIYRNPQAEFTRRLLAASVRDVPPESQATESRVMVQEEDR